MGIRRWFKFWWQRRTRGWDDSELWNLDCSLAAQILPRLQAFASDLQGHPADLEFEEWQKAIGKMVSAFEVIGSDAYWCMDEGQRKDVQEGLDLFAKHFTGLWN